MPLTEIGTAYGHSSKVTVCPKSKKKNKALTMKCCQTQLQGGTFCWENSQAFEENILGTVGFFPLLFHTLSAFIS